MKQKWLAQTEQLAGDRGIQTAICAAGQPLSYADVLELLAREADFRAFFNTLLAAAPYLAFRWETPPLSTATKNRPFEFVLLDSPGLARSPDGTDFAPQFAAAPKCSVLSFRNLGNDAQLIVPRAQGPVTAYGHLAAFVREAPETQQHALWQLVGEVVAKQIGHEPLWLSTAGAGVPWLHVRVDSRPKYYGHRPYREGR